MNNNKLYTDEYFMKIALKESLKAYKNNEVPVGAIAVYNNKIIAKSYNQTEKRKSVTGHAELLLINKISKILNDWRLNNVTIYVTKKPCIMCMGAIINSRVSKLVYSIDDDHQRNDYERYKKNIIIKNGILKEECLKIFKNFFKNLRC